MQETLDGSDYVELGSSDEWETPQSLFDELNDKYVFDLDPCATPDNAKCKCFFTKKDNGLRRSWKGYRVFMNPPYSDISSWVKKACSEQHATIIVALLPAWTDRLWFHEYVYDKTEITFLQGRVKFLMNGEVKKSPRFGSMVVIWK